MLPFHCAATPDSWEQAALRTPAHLAPLQNQLYALKRKLGIRDVAGLVRYAIRAGLGNASD